MSDIGKTALKNKIDAKIYDNESQLITGAILNEVLQDAVDTLADGGNLDAGSVDTANLNDEAVTKGKLEQNVSADLDWAVASNSYYRNSQAGDVAAKVITTYKNMNLIGGGSLKVTFEQANTADDATLNIDGKGAKPLYYNGQRVSSTNSWEAGETVEIYYNNYTTGIYYAKRWMVKPVSVSQNIETGHTDITIGDKTTTVASVDDVEFGVGELDPSVLTGSTSNTSYIFFQITPKLKHISRISFLAKQGTTNFFLVNTNTTPVTITQIKTVENTAEENNTVKTFDIDIDLPDGVYLGYNGDIRYAATSSALDGYIGGNCATDGTELHLGDRFMAGFKAFCAVKNYVLDEFEDIETEIKEIQEKESFEVGIVDSSILTSSTTNNDVVFFQRTPICSHIDKIRFLAKTGTTKFYKVNLRTTPATITQIKEIVTTSEESNTIKEFGVNIDLLGSEYIGFNGTICYKAVSGVPDGFIGAFCNIDGTSIQQDSKIAYGYELVTSVKDIAVELNKQVATLEGEHISLETVGTDLSTTLPQGTNNTSYIFVIKTPTALGEGVKINYAARTGTINFFKIHTDAISVGEIATITPIASIVNASEEQGNIKSIEIDVDFSENDYLGVNGSFYYMTQAHGADNPNFTSFSLNASTGEIEDATINVFVVGCNIVVKSIKEIRKTPKNIVFVDAQGNGDYLTPFDAMVALLGKDTTTNPYTIVVAPGVYITPTLSFADKYRWCQNRYLSIVGTDKNNCIIRNDEGYYNADAGLGDNAPIKLSGNIYIANLTIISTDNENASQEDEVYHLSYCIHIDSAAPEGSIMEIHNCRLVNNHAPCIGFGLPKNVLLKITDCELEADFFNPSGAANAVICGHDREGASSTEVQEHLMVKNCIIKSSNGDAIKVWNNRGFLTDCIFVGNACDLPSGRGVNLSAGTTTVISPSFGNNIEGMNLPS